MKWPISNPIFAILRENPNFPLITWMREREKKCVIALYNITKLFAFLSRVECTLLPFPYTHCPGQKHKQLWDVIYLSANTAKHNIESICFLKLLLRLAYAKIQIFRICISWMQIAWGVLISTDEISNQCFARSINKGQCPYGSRWKVIIKNYSLSIWNEETVNFGQFRV